MKLAFFGDVVGKPGRQAVLDHLPGLKARLRLDFVVVNAENSAGGFGLTSAIAEEFFAAGADCLTLGDHAWDQREALTYIERVPRLLRPLNYPPAANAPGKGANLFSLPDGRRVGVIQVQGNVFMKQVLSNPFSAVDEALDSMPLGAVADAVIVDMHCEATSEKMAMGHYCDGRASLVVGSHTHVPTADTMILEAGTAYQTDAGMCGDYNSVIGMDKSNSLKRFFKKSSISHFPANGKATICGVIVEANNKNGLANKIDSFIFGGELKKK